MATQQPNAAIGHQVETKPNPDPTIATNEAVERAMKSERDYVDGQIAILVERLTGIDRATMLRVQAIDHMPAQIVVEVNRLETLFESQLNSLAARTAEQKADTTKALTDALAAQKEAVASQTASSEKSITKSETATTERIKGVEALLATTAKSTDDKIGDLKDRIVAIESVKLGGLEERGEHRQGGQYSLAIMGGIFGFVGIAIAIISFIIANKP